MPKTFGTTYWSLKELKAIGGGTQHYNAQPVSDPF